MLADLQKLVKKYDEEIAEANRNNESLSTELYAARCVFEGREFEYEKRSWGELAAAMNNAAVDFIHAEDDYHWLIARAQGRIVAEAVSAFLRYC